MGGKRQAVIGRWGTEGFICLALPPRVVEAAWRFIGVSYGSPERCKRVWSISELLKRQCCRPGVSSNCRFRHAEAAPTPAPAMPKKVAIRRDAASLPRVVDGR